MSRLLKPLPAKYLPMLHRWMILQDFPGTPRDYEDALPSLEETHLFGVFATQAELPMAVIILGNRQDNCAYVDVICAPSMQGRWLTRSIIQQFRQLVFKQLCLTYIWCQPLRDASVNLAAKLGFKPVQNENYWLLSQS